MKTIFLLLHLPFLLLGQDSIKRYELSEIQIRGVQINSVKNTSQVLVPDSLKSFGQETPILLSKSLSVISTSDNGTPFGYSYLKIRGVDYSRINYSLNGVPLNDGEDMTTYTSNYTNLFSSLGRVDIYRGAGTSSNGVASYGGLVDLKFDDLSKEKKEVEVMYGSFNSSLLSGKYSHFSKNWKSYIALSKAHTDGFREHSFGDSELGIFLTEYKNKKTLVRLNSFLGGTRNGMSWLPTPEGLSYKRNLLSDKEKDDFTQSLVQLQLTQELGEDLFLNISPYWVQIKGGYSYGIDYEKDIYGGLKLNGNNYGFYSNLVYSPTSNFVINTGVTGNFQNREHIGMFMKSIDYINRGIKNDLTLYSKSNYSLSKWTFSYDLQLRNVNLDYLSSTLNTNLINKTFFNSKIEVTRELFTNISGYSSFANVYREPTRTDLLGVNDNLTDLNQIQTVSPENVKDIEVGIKWRGKLKGSLNIYSMNFNNEILSTNQINYLGILLRKNVEKSSRNGIESYLEYSTKDFKLSTNNTFSQNRVLLDNTADKEPILSPKWISNSEVEYRGKVDIALSHQYLSSSYLENTNDIRYQLPAYHVLNLRTSIDLSNKLRLSLLVNNLLNKNYRTSGNVSYNSSGDIESRNFFYQSGINSYLNLNMEL